MQVAVLPVHLRPSQPVQLLRLGAPQDGGYLINPGDIAAADGLISMGIDRDWRFEKEFLHRRARSVPVHAYDGCTSMRYLLSNIPRALRARNWGWVYGCVHQGVDYLRFFSGSVRHIRCFVGTGQFAYRASAAGVVPVEQVFESMYATGSSRPFIKMDIEGAEYLLLDELVRRAETSAGLAIEFHDCDQRMEEIIAFVQRYPLTLIHVHANPYGGIGAGGIPRALELTFSSTAGPTEAAPLLPHPMDRPNDGSADIALRFA